MRCPECTLALTLPPLAHRQKALCPRCGYQLTQYRNQALDKVLAYSLAALCFLGASLPFDFMIFSSRGQFQTISIPLSISTLMEQDYLLLAAVQIMAIYLLPACILLGLIYLCLFLRRDRYPPRGAWVKRLIYAMLPWSMAEIFLVGALISLIKMNDIAEIHLGMSFYAYLIFTLCFIAVLYYLDEHQLVEQLRHSGQERWQKAQRQPKPPGRMIQRTWALLLAATILYIPANLLPIMNTRLLGRDDPSTILSGVVKLWQNGSYPIAVIIFVASLLVPVSKLLVLGWLTYSIQRQSRMLKKWRTHLYRITDFIGRWSMLDVFVVAILVSLVQMGNTMAVYPGPAAIAFAAVVIITMLAANSFDARMIWNPKLDEK
ncbi:paraquat-inducible protein A [Bowmanella dokdonensis]|uniref:Paraquat-inducible protein A n=2 Tax=Bowmanella dokdonensis TaxID=751969 RepID=A0A939DPG9_9ALTE|nr:paraquat-inducible protein A [Bowmanella dokdonensis]MBN7826387.1 paraquat-inducible protein A [Bowmanella dokdonensis]